MFGSTWRSATPPGRVAERARGLDVVVASSRPASRRAPRASKHRRGGDADRDHRVAQVGAEEGGQRDRQDQEREGQHRIDDAAEHRVGPAAGEAREQAGRHADRASAISTDTTPASRLARAPNITRAKHVAAVLVGAHPVRRRRRLADRRPVGRRSGRTARASGANTATRTNSATTARPSHRRRPRRRSAASPGGTGCAAAAPPAGRAVPRRAALMPAQPRVDHHVQHVGQQVQQRRRATPSPARRPGPPDSPG